ncbi:tetratricopeptide repeat protein [Candidatus Accumulibacter sp. ACC003]|uniref:tetratricopeptide repeat protein n=1 Tax=Candidatus Accumulibacter sp. ACC003 TaxID=2823334 RepID=UPI0025C0E51C|nr:tetratricopeptide repeat protein [Candidatus Accumulibacter sp. ACC003]
MAHLQLFLSAVSAEFRGYRDVLRHELTRPNVSVAVQEDFIVSGSATLDLLDDYIRHCAAVIHLVGDMTGALALAPSLTLIRSRYPDLGEKLPPLLPFLQPGAPALSYTQWEAWLALYHGKPLIIAAPADGAPRGEGYQMIAEQRAAQDAHLQRLAAVERYPGPRFTSPELLAIEVLRSRLFDLFVAAGLARRVIHLPYPSLGDLFKGRAAMLDDLCISLTNALATGASAIVGRALHGLGGVGKTRLAVEYAWRHVDDYSALLLVGADGAETLSRNLAALCAPALLDLPENRVTQEAAQVSAVLTWLQRNPGWLLIVDNVDTEAAAQTVEALLPQVPGGHVLITSRLSNWSGGVEALPLDVLEEPAAVAFLLARTDARRRQQADDAAQARSLAAELGGLALALEQAAAYIAQRRLTLAGYLLEWRGQRDKVLAWHDARLMKYPRSVAVTWQTSFEQLGEPARRLLRRLAWLAAAPIPESLLDVAAAGAAAEDDAYAALAELESYSLVTRADETASFTVHRLVQEVTRRGAAAATLGEALGWINDAFVGDPRDVRDWPVLDPLLPHARAVAGHGDEAGIAAPTARLMNQAGLLLLNKALHAEAEPLMRRALAIDEQSLGAEHPDVARDLNNLAQLLQATNRLADAEPLMRRALAIDEQSFGAEHPNVARDLNNLAHLLQDTNRFADAEPLMRRALAIDEQSFGAEHPHVARDVNNLAALLHATKRLAEAEPLMRRALAIDEESFGVEHPDVAIDLNNLAQLLKTTKRLAEAEPLMRRALAIDERSLGAEHPHVAIDLNNLAGLLHATKRLAEAEPLMRRALAIDEQSFGAEHPDVSRDLNNLAQLLQDTKRLAEAEPLMRRALAIVVASLGAEHPNSQTAMRNYVVLLGEMGHGDDEVLERFHSLRRELLGQPST